MHHSHLFSFYHSILLCILFHWRENVLINGGKVLTIRNCKIKKTFCIRTLPRGGMYWEMHTPRPKRLPQGTREGRWVQNPCPPSRSLGVHFPIHRSSQTANVHIVPIWIIAGAFSVGGCVPDIRISSVSTNIVPGPVFPNTLPREQGVDEEYPI